MQLAEDNHHLLLGYFREFYRCVGQQLEEAGNAGKKRLSAPSDSAIAPSSNEGQSLALSTNAPANSALSPIGTTAELAMVNESSRAAIQQNLLSFFELQTRRAREDGCRSYDDAQYVMTALADEKFIKLDWADREDWLAHLLESRLFKSHTAGIIFFQRLDRILRERDPADRELAGVYLMALSLGFRGQFHGPESDNKLAQYRRHLFAFVFHRQPGVENLPYLFPQAHENTLREKRKARLPRLRLWQAALCLAIVLYLGVSHGLWSTLIKPLGDLNQSISKIVGELNSK